jgi:O-antigen ligase
MLFYFEDRTIIILLQVIINLGLFFIVFTKESKLKFHKTYTPIILAILAYNLLTIIFSTNLIPSINKSFKFLIPIVYFFVGFSLVKNLKNLKKLADFSWIYLAYFVGYMIIVNIFNIGEPLYKGGISKGFFSINGFYIPCFVCIFLIFNFRYLSPSKKLITKIMFITSILIFFILLKRTLIALIAISLVLTLIRSAKYVLIVSVIGIIAVTLFSGNIKTLLDNNSNIQGRGSRFTSEYSITKEGRFTENVIIYNLLKKSMFQFVFGTGEVFNDAKYISKYYAVEREAHNSFIRLLWNGGAIGLGLFLFFYFAQVNGLFYYRKRNKNKDIKRLLLFGIYFVILRFINDFSSGITYLAFNAYCYLLIGGVIRLGNFKERIIQRTNIKTIKSNT